MLKVDIMNRMEACGAMAIVYTESIERRKEIVGGCLQDGIDAMKVNYTLPNVGDVITASDHEFGRTMLVGAGIILDVETCRMVILAGAKLIIAPNFSRGAVHVYNRYQIPYASGCTAIIETLGALKVGTSYTKTFLISNFYGPQLTKIIQTPVPEMPLVASDGVSLNNLKEWLENGVSYAGSSGLLTNGTRAEIANNTTEVRRIVDIYRK